MTTCQGILRQWATFLTKYVTGRVEVQLRWRTSRRFCCRVIFVDHSIAAEVVGSVCVFIKTMVEIGRACQCAFREAMEKEESREQKTHVHFHPAPQHGRCAPKAVKGSRGGLVAELSNHVYLVLRAPTLGGERAPLAQGAAAAYR